MNRNRLKPANSLQTHKLWKLFTLCFVLTLFGLVFVFLQVKIIRLADDNRKLELTLDEIRKKNAGLYLQVDKLKSPRFLEQKLAYLKMGMVPISSLAQVEARIPSQSMRPPGSLLAKREAYRER
ncbi:MAG: hypothetical protein PHD76_10175 [Methylacidiphilales bacterium]|nr:hypothetical protein [Candidatus Methylacidiphilales bacterium]